jgi:(Z)-2-((N-methylformamido)methylene)-5-hydroxybutyrolactone dehydrogenase
VSLTEYKTYIAGRWVDAASGERFESDNPYTGKPWALIPRCAADDVDRAVRAAHTAFISGEWPTLTPSGRGALLRRLGDLVSEHSQFLAEIEVRDNGKLLAEMKPVTAYMAQWYHYYGGLADKIEGAVIPTDKPDTFNYTRYEPLGVVAAIVPWNSPLFLTTWKLAPALAAGNTIVIKPSEFTSASLLEFMKLVEQAGIPPGVVNVVTGFGAEVGMPLVEHPLVAKVAFTGSDSTGQRVYEAAARGMKRVSMELGGKSPNIVFDDAHLDNAVKRRGVRDLRGNGTDLRGRIAAARATENPRSVRREAARAREDGEDRQSHEPRHAGRTHYEQAAAREGAQVHRDREGRRRDADAGRQTRFGA